jgi:1,4-alpha-glucan branching enzyme
VVGDDRLNSVFAFLRLTPENAIVLVVCNMTPVVRHDYRVGVPASGLWREILNSDSGFYGGSNLGNNGQVEAAPFSSHGCSQSLSLLLPPLSTIFLRHEG